MAHMGEATAKRDFFFQALGISMGKEFTSLFWCYVKQIDTRFDSITGIIFFADLAQMFQRVS